ncbi:MAG: metal-dependent transcriptional regulator [Clostridia bacterium]|nr:metal-dependent transcriptional regulator [Clostridia bacterium]
MAIQESGEMYLETILILSKKKHVVRSIDIAEYMGFSRPAVSRAMGKLKEEKYIVMDQDGYITLTEKGQGVSESIYERHVVLAGFLMQLGVDEETANKDACRIEHIISSQTFDRMKEHMAQGETQPETAVKS